MLRVSQSNRSDTNTIFVILPSSTVQQYMHKRTILVLGTKRSFNIQVSGHVNSIERDRHSRYFSHVWIFSRKPQYRRYRVFGIDTGQTLYQFFSCFLVPALFPVRLLLLKIIASAFYICNYELHFPFRFHHLRTHFDQLCLSADQNCFIET